MTMPDPRRTSARLFFACLSFSILVSCGGGGGGSVADSGPIAPVIEPGTMTACEAPDRPPLNSGYTTENPFPNLGLINVPTTAVQHPAHPGRWYMVRQHGQILYFDESDPATFHDFLSFNPVVRPPEANGRGRALGMEFHPDYPNTPEVFIYYTGMENGVFSSVLKRVVLDDLDQPVSPVDYTVISHPIQTQFHQGGDVKFGPDGYLYIAFGDDGGGGSVRAQDNTNLFGSMLRLDVASISGAGYDIPADNPFAANQKCDAGMITGQPCPEIFAWGFRNPFRWSFDANGRFWLGDVGTNRQEEIDWVEKGNNYGWGCYEGSLVFDINACDGPEPDVEFPVFEYSHGNGDQAVLGGEVYTGSIPGLQGKYVFGDIVSGRIWALADDGLGNLTQELIVDTPYQLTDFVTGLDGELYFVARNAGQLHRIVADDTDYVQTIPTLLSDTHCVDESDPTVPAAALTPYEINAPFWSDGAVKTRYVALPDGATPVSPVAAELDFPIGTVLLKNFELSGQLVETRLMMRHPDGQWAGYTWEWNDEQTEAYRVVGGKTAPKHGQDWIYPSEAQCMVCHNSAAGYTLGPETAQLNRDIPDGMGGVVNQLDQLISAGILLDFPAGYTVPQISDYLDDGLPLNDRARAWLDTNCAGCHRDEGFTPSTMDLRYNVPLSSTAACNAIPAFGNLGLSRPWIIDPGNPDNSILHLRMSRRDEFGMPPLGSKITDPVGVALIRDWITSLSDCQ